jgi:hypothetical protein
VAWFLLGAQALDALEWAALARFVSISVIWTDVSLVSIV